MANISQINGLLINAATASLATTASYAVVAQSVLGSITSASYAATASLLLGSVQSASYAATASLVTTASYAVTASVIQSIRNTNNTTLYLTAVDSFNSTATEEILYGVNITTNPANASITANSVTASFTGSLTGTLTGTSSWATNAVTASRILTQTDNTNASYFLTFVDANNGTPTAESLLTANNVTINPALRSLSTQGAVTASTGFLGPLTGSVFGTASYVTGSIFTSANPVLSASYALNGGVTQIVAGTNVTLSPTNGLGAVTINATGGGPGSSDFPYTGSAIISGSLIVTGSVSAGLGGFTGSLLGTASFSTNTFTNLKKTRLEMGISSAQTITTGAKGRKTVSFNGTIVGWRLVADQATFTDVDIWKANSAIPTIADSITAGAYPSLNTAQLASSTTLTGWTTSVSAGDVFILSVVTNDTAKYLFLELDIVLTNA